MKNIMNFKTWASKMINESESLKDKELNRILDKISSGETLSEIEKRFLSNYGAIPDEFYQDFSFLTKNDVFDRIKEMLETGRKVVCDLTDRDGKIGVEIESVNNYIDSEFCHLILKNNQRVDLKDSYLYNIIFNPKKDEYSLQIQDEFYEKLPISNE